MRVFLEPWFFVPHGRTLHPRDAAKGRPGAFHAVRPCPWDLGGATANQLGRCSVEGAKGKAIVKVLPTPGSEVAQIRPPWAVISMRQI